MIEEHVRRAVVDELTRPMTKPEPAQRPKPLSGRERSQVYSREYLMLAHQAFEMQKIAAGVDDIPMAMSDQVLNREEKSPQDLDKMRAAERKRYRKKNRGW